MPSGISTGVILAGILQGALVENIGHYAVYWFAAVLAAISLWLCSRVREA